ncbi:MAG TPA: hypothetical protein VNV60_01965 [Holophagaceae bacterium]|jgi:hypothetical protein|nr:hypothetical protein [Holophagaceae bacterium]
MPGFEFIAREHPAIVHLPIAASLLLPLPLFLALRNPVWFPAVRLQAWAGFAGGMAAILSGFLWARSMDLIAPGALMPAHPGLIATHEWLALSGLGAGLAALILVELKRLRPALVVALIWAVLWGATGHWGGKMVFPEPDAVSQNILSTESPWATWVLPKSS